MIFIIKRKTDVEGGGDIWYEGVPYATKKAAIAAFAKARDTTYYGVKTEYIGIYERVLQ